MIADRASRAITAALVCGLLRAAVAAPVSARVKLAAHPKPPAKTFKKTAAPVRSQTLPRVPTGDAAHERRVQALRDQLESILHDPVVVRLRVGVVAERLSDGDVLFSRNAEQRFNPASNTKMLTTGAAIARLGGDFRYLTALYGPQPDPDGVVSGDVVLRGSSDPSFGTGDLAELARTLASRGITRIRGDLVVDRRPIGFDGAATLGVDGLILNRNAVSVRVRPTEVKHAAIVTVEPALVGVTVENHTTTVKGKRTRLSLDTHRKDEHLVIEVRGRIGESHGTAMLARHVNDGALMSGHTLAAMLPDFGVTLEGTVRGGQAKSPDADELAVHHSIPLSDVSRLSNKPSNNFIADAIYKTLGGELFGLPGTLEKGTRAVSEWLVDHGIAKDRFHLVNGSGLTHENRVTPGDLVKLLRAVYYEPDVAPDFIPSLSVGGIDGTLRNRFGGSAVGLVRAKTGTLDGVSTLSGYVGDKGDVIVFSIMVEGHRWRRTPLVRHVQVELVDAMLHFLRSDLPGAEPVRPTPEALHQDGIVGPPPSPPAPGDEDDEKSDDTEPEAMP